MTSELVATVLPLMGNRGSFAAQYLVPGETRSGHSELRRQQSVPGQDLFKVLTTSPERRFPAEYLAEQLHIPDGKCGVAGVLARPVRQCRKVGRLLAVGFTLAPAGGGADYWIAAAALFAAAATA